MAVELPVKLSYLRKAIKKQSRFQNEQTNQAEGRGVEEEEGNNAKGENVVTVILWWRGRWLLRLTISQGLQKYPCKLFLSNPTENHQLLLLKAVLNKPSIAEPPQYNVSNSFLSMNNSGWEPGLGHSSTRPRLLWLSECCWSGWYHLSGISLWQAREYS